MALPIINTPEFEATIPSSGKQIFFRPFLVKEEKILFMALQGNDPSEITNAVKRILTACILTDDIDVDKLATFDVEYLFLKLRGKSVGENIELSLRHSQSECEHTQQVSVDIDSINVQFPEGYTNTIMLNDDVGIKLRHPSIGDASKVTNASDFDSIVGLIADCVESVFDPNTVYEDFTKQQLVEFIEALNQKQFEQVRQFFEKTPKLSHKIEWTCPQCEKNEKITIEGLSNFFT